MLKLFILCLLCCSIANGQVVLEKKYFEDSQWASLNKDSLFFKADTVKMVNLGQNNSLNLAQYFNKSDFVTFELKRSKEMKFQTFQVDAWTVTTLYGKYSWMFNNSEKILSLFYSNKLMISFKVIYELVTEISSNYVNKPPFKTNEVTFIRVRN